MEEEAEKLKEMQGEVEKQLMGSKPGVCVRACVCACVCVCVCVCICYVQGRVLTFVNWF